MKPDNLKFFAPNQRLTDAAPNGSLWEQVKENKVSSNNQPKDHYSNYIPPQTRESNNFLNNQYNNPNMQYQPNYYQQGGQAETQQQGQPDEGQIVQAIVQAFQQLSPQGQQAVVQALSQAAQGGGQQDPAQATPQEQYTPPQQRMGGMQRRSY